MHARRTLLVATVLAFPLLSAGAQGRRRPVQAPGGEAPPISATELLDGRRDLDLSPRQVARLDSIERSQVAQRRLALQQMQKQRDSLCANRNPCHLSDEERESFRSRLGRDGPDSFRRSDSLGRSLAFSILDSTQRGQVQGWRQGRRREMMARGRMREEMGPPSMSRGWHEPRFRRQQRGPHFEGFGRRGMGRDGQDMQGMRRPMRRRGPDGEGPQAQEPRVRPDTLPDSTR